jgi:hypothetical protein
MSVQVVVDGESTDLESVGDVFNGFAEIKSPELIKATYDVLFALTVQLGEGAAKFAFCLLDEPVECSLEATSPVSTNQLAFEPQWYVAIDQFVRPDDGAAEGRGQGNHPLEK